MVIGRADVEDAYRRYFPLIRRKCGRTLRDPVEAEDLAQEVFMRFWRERARIDDPVAVTAWLYRTATNLAVDRLRSRRATPVDDDTLLGLAPPAPGNPETESHARVLLRDFLAAIPADLLKAAILSRVDGLTHPEAAGVLGISERTLRRMLTKFEARATHFRKARGEMS